MSIIHSCAGTGTTRLVYDAGISSEVCFHQSSLLSVLADGCPILKVFFPRCRYPPSTSSTFGLRRPYLLDHPLGNRWILPYFTSPLTSSTLCNSIFRIHGIDSSPSPSFVHDDVICLKEFADGSRDDAACSPLGAFLATYLPSQHNTQLAGPTVFYYQFASPPPCVRFIGGKNFNRISSPTLIKFTKGCSFPLVLGFPLPPSLPPVLRRLDEKASTEPSLTNLGPPFGGLSLVPHICRGCMTLISRSHRRLHHAGSVAGLSFPERINPPGLLSRQIHCCDLLRKLPSQQ